jgi:hypothetical protein
LQTPPSRSSGIKSISRSLKPDCFCSITLVREHCLSMPPSLRIFMGDRYFHNDKQGMRNAPDIVCTRTS